MSLSIFSGSVGVISAVYTGQTLPIAILLGGGSAIQPDFPMYSVGKAILTGFKITGSSNLGLTTTLRDRIYAYSFSEKPGDAILTGLAFAGTCDGPQGWSGFDTVYSYYERLRSSTQGAPVRLVLGPKTVLYGFLHSYSFNLEDTQTGIGTFSFMFKMIPRTSGLYAFTPLPWEW
jgi:hypothetical protein